MGGSFHGYVSHNQMVGFGCFWWYCMVQNMADIELELEFDELELL